MKYIHPKRTCRMLIKTLHDFVFFYLIPDKWEIKYRFKKRLGYRLNLKSPVTFNEKIQWLKINDHDERYPLLIDKYRVKKTVGEIIGVEHIIPTIAGGYKEFDEIPFDTLPNKFVVKCNHDAGSVVICNNKETFDYELAKATINKAIHQNYYHQDGKQWGYKKVKPTIFVEKYIEPDDNQEEITDYKFMMFNGICKCVFTCAERHSESGLKLNFYDPQWNLLPFTRHYPNTSYEIPRPDNYDEMLQIASSLAQFVNNRFVRVDLYSTKKHIYFGELTFYPGGGLEEFTPQEWDKILGSWLVL